MIHKKTGVSNSINNIKPIEGIDKLKPKDMAIIVSDCLLSKLENHGVVIEVNPKYKRSRGALYFARWEEDGRKRAQCFDSHDIGWALSETALKMGVKKIDACYYVNIDKMEREFRRQLFGGPGFEQLFTDTCKQVNEYMEQEIRNLMEP
jgi:hypothetical protein